MWQNRSIVIDQNYAPFVLGAFTDKCQTAERHELHQLNTTVVIYELIGGDYPQHGARCMWG